MVRSLHFDDITANVRPWLSPRQSTLDGSWFLGDDGEQDSGAAIGRTATLLPVLEGVQREAIVRGEGCLRHSASQSDAPDIDLLRDLEGGG